MLCASTPEAFNVKSSVRVIAGVTEEGDSMPIDDATYTRPESPEPDGAALSVK